MPRRPSDTEPADDQAQETPTADETPTAPTPTPVVLEPVKRMCCGKDQPCRHDAE